MLAQFAEDGDRSAWGIGDITATLEEELYTVPKGVLYNAVGQFSNRSPHTIRDYCWTSRNVPVSVRNEFDMMGRHHLKALIPHVDEMGGWHKACTTVLSWGDDYGGNLIPVHALREKLSGAHQEPAWLRRTRSARNTLARVAEDEDTPQELREFAFDFVSATGPWDVSQPQGEQGGF